MPFTAVLQNVTLQLTGVGITFRSCTNLAGITIPHSVNSIGEGAFYGCINLSSVIIENGVENIGSSAFSHCDKLENIIIPNSVTSIGTSAFYQTAYYNNEANWENDILYIGNYLIKVKNTADTCKIKSETNCIAENAFAACNKLSRIDTDSPNFCIEEGILFNKDKTELIKYPPSKADTTYRIPNTVIKIREYAFQNCNNLNDIYYSGTEEDWKTIAIGSYNESLITVTIHYDSDSITPTPSTKPSTEPTIDQSTTTVTKQNANTYKFNVNLENIDQDCNMITALYDENGAFAGFKETPVKSGSTSEIVDVAAQNAKIAKVFLWKDLLNPAPLCKAAEIPIEN